MKINLNKNITCNKYLLISCFRKNVRMRDSANSVKRVLSGNKVRK